MLATDDTVLSRTVTSRCCEVNRYEALGYAFVMMLKLHQFQKKWQYDLGGNRVCTMFRKRDPIMDSSTRDTTQLDNKRWP